jgi:hypothetical protein
MTDIPAVDALEVRILALELEIESMRAERACLRCGTSATLSTKLVPMDSLKPSQAIIACLREFDRPVGVGTLRQRIQSKGYPMEKFGPNKNYFYTLICRLAESQKIMKDGDEVMMAG